MSSRRAEANPILILRGTVWHSQAVAFFNSHGLPTAPVDRATSTANGHTLGNALSPAGVVSHGHRP